MERRLILTPDEFARQTLMVDSLLESHPEFEPSSDDFTAAELEVFSSVFRPDWDSLGDYRVVYDKLFGHDQPLMHASQQVLAKFCLLHGLEPVDPTDQ